MPEFHVSYNLTLLLHQASSSRTAFALWKLLCRPTDWRMSVRLNSFGSKMLLCIMFPLDWFVDLCIWNCYVAIHSRNTPCFWNIRRFRLYLVSTGLLLRRFTSLRYLNFLETSKLIWNNNSYSMLQWYFWHTVNATTLQLTLKRGRREWLDGSCPYRFLYNFSQASFNAIVEANDLWSVNLTQRSAITCNVSPCTSNRGTYKHTLPYCGAWSTKHTLISTSFTKLQLLGHDKYLHIRLTYVLFTL